MDDQAVVAARPIVRSALRPRSALVPSGGSRELATGPSRGTCKTTCAPPRSAFASGALRNRLTAGARDRSGPRTARPDLSGAPGVRHEVSPRRRRAIAMAPGERQRRSSTPRLDSPKVTNASRSTGRWTRSGRDQGRSGPTCSRSPLPADRRERRGWSRLNTGALAVRIRRSKIAHSAARIRGRESSRGPLRTPPHRNPPPRDRRSAGPSTTEGTEGRGPAGGQVLSSPFGAVRSILSVRDSGALCPDPYRSSANALTRYTFESAAPKARLGRFKTLSKGLKNFVLDDATSLDEALASAHSDESRESTAQQLDAFHQTFNFCMSCRQYTCPNCWNEAEGQCSRAARSDVSGRSRGDASAPQAVPTAPVGDRGMSSSLGRRRPAPSAQERPPPRSPLPLAASRGRVPVVDPSRSGARAFFEQRAEPVFEAVAAAAFTVSRRNRDIVEEQRRHADAGPTVPEAAAYAIQKRAAARPRTTSDLLAKFRPGRASTMRLRRRGVGGEGLTASTLAVAAPSPSRNPSPGPSDPSGTEPEPIAWP